MSELTQTTDTAQPQIGASPSALLSRPMLMLATLDWERITYVVFFVVALITRLWGLGDRVMSHDESLHTQFSYSYYRGDGYQHTPLMHGPSLFHITALSYWLFGPNDFSARLPVAIVGSILVVMPYLLRRELGRAGALVTSFLLLISPMITYYSRYIRHDIYLITCAFIIFIATWYYIRQRRERYIWWFVAALALMFTTMEAAFIYVAIFGSFLTVRIAVRVLGAPWLRAMLPRLKWQIILLIVSLILIVGGLAGVRLSDAEAEAEATATATSETQGFAADPNEQLDTSQPVIRDVIERVMRWMQIVGLGGLALALFLTARTMRPEIDAFPEFDLIVLYSTLLLPLVSPFLTRTAGYNPQDYTLSTCQIAGEETMSALQVFGAKLFNPVCYQALAGSGIARSGFFLILTLVIGILVGLWWNRRRWLIAAVIFNAIFITLFTSFFTNPNGWGSGTIGSLGYWLEQQAVRRGNQPYFYYFFLVPFYEFLPLIFSMLAIRYWTRLKRLNAIVGYWLTFLLSALLVFSITNWIVNRRALLAGELVERDITIGLVLAIATLLVGFIFWVLKRSPDIRREYELSRGWRGLVAPTELVGFVPNIIWWLFFTWVAYSLAGEKMPWLTSHYVTPMALLSGWYLGLRLKNANRSELLSRRNAAYLGLAALFIVLTFLTVQPFLVGHVTVGDQQAENLRALGRLLGSLVLLAGVGYLLWRFRDRLQARTRQLTWVLSVFLLLSLLTIRFTYMASFPNADYAREFLVYAHAAPAVKQVVLPQIEELSLRLYGDLSMQVAWDDDSTWPMQWYLKEFPNRVYFGTNPNRSITDAPVVIAGSKNWANVEPVLGDDYEARTYTFLWWPTEDYRRFSWNALFGVADWEETPESPYPSPRGLGAPEVREALWNIFFHRDYTDYGQVFGKSQQVTAGQWEPRHDLRLYIRKDVLANLWDYGVSAAAIEPPIDPYAEGEIPFAPIAVMGAAGSGPAQFTTPRNIAIGPDGNLYVADSGNHRIQVLDSDGNFLREWGQFGSAPGELNEPWGITVDSQFVYVADTWNYRVQKFTLDGEFVHAWGESGVAADIPGDSGGFFFGPRDVELLPDGQLAVTDTGNHRIQIFDRDGNFIRAVGSPGGLLGQFNEPVGLAGGLSSNIYLADTWNGRIQKFDPGFFPILEWPIDGWEGNSTNNKPYVAVDSLGRVYTTDPENFRVLIFDANGTYLARFGRFSSGSDGFGLPNGIAIASDDTIYVTDAANGRVLKFAPLSLANQPAGAPGSDVGGAEEGAADGPEPQAPIDEQEGESNELPISPTQ